jgi:hypothetical protein
MSPNPAYRGIWPSEHDYIVEQLAEHLPPHMAWVLACCDPAKLREGYEAGKLRVWSTPHQHRPGHVLVFEARRR